MRKLFEEDGVYNEAHANELLRVQTLYNQKLQALNNELAKQKAQLAIKYMNATKTQQAQAANQATQNQPKPTGNVNPAGQPTDAQGNVKTVESVNILNITEINEEIDEPVRFTRQFIPNDKYSWVDKADKKDDRIAREVRQALPKKRHNSGPRYGSDAYWKRKDTIDTLEGEIEDIKQNIEYYEEKFSTPTFRGVQGEIEQFFADAGFEASDILNQGIPRVEKVKELKAAGIKDAEDLVDNYYYYYPQHDDTTAKERKAAEKEVAKLEIQLAAKEKRLEKYMYESVEENIKTFVNESVYDTTQIDPGEYQELKNYLDAQNVSYIEDEDAGTIEFDDTDIDDEWAQRLPEKFEDEDNAILSVKDDGVDDPEKVAAMDDKIDEDKVFYVKIEDEGDVFYGKVYKLFDEGDWRTKLVKGESDTFEKLNYDPDWDEFDVISFLRDNYADAELIDESEFNKIVESADDRDPMFPFPGDKYEIIGDALSPRHRTLNLDIEPTTTNTSGTGHYEFQIGDILTYDDSNDYDSSFWITPDGRRGRIWSLPRSLVANHILQKVKYQRIHENKLHSIPTLDEFVE